MFGPVGERLDAVEDARRRVRDRPQPRPIGHPGQRLGQQQPAAAAGDHDPQQLVVGPGAGVRQQPPGVGADGVEIDRQAEVGG